MSLLTSQTNANDKQSFYQASGSVGVGVGAGSNIIVPSLTTTGSAGGYYITVENSSTSFYSPSGLVKSMYVDIDNSFKLASKSGPTFDFPIVITTPGVTNVATPLLFTNPVNFGGFLLIPSISENSGAITFSGSVTQQAVPSTRITNGSRVLLSVTVPAGTLANYNAVVGGLIPNTSFSISINQLPPASGLTVNWFLLNGLT